MVWLSAIALFPILAATYLGGAAIHIEGGGAGRQMAGLMLNYGVFIGVFAGLRLAVASLTGPVLSVALALLGAAILLPLLARLAFRAVGVRITSADAVRGQSAA